MFIRIRRRWRFVQVGQFWNAFKSPFQKCFRFPRVLKNTLMLLLRDKQLTKPWPFRRSFSTVSMKKVENFAAVWLSLINDYRRRLQILARAIRTRTKAQTLHRCTTQCAPSLAVSNSFSDHAPSLSISPIYLTFWSTRPAYSSLYVYICSANSQEPLSAYISLSHIHTLLSSDVRRVRIFSQVNELVGPSNALLSANPFHRSINLSQPPTPVLH